MLVSTCSHSLSVCKNSTILRLGASTSVEESQKWDIFFSATIHYPKIKGSFTASLRAMHRVTHIVKNNTFTLLHTIGHETADALMFDEYAGEKEARSTPIKNGRI